MNIVNISYMTRQEIESSYHLFDKDQLAAAVERLIKLVDESSSGHSFNPCGCCCED